MRKTLKLVVKTAEKEVKEQFFSGKKLKITEEKINKTWCLLREGRNDLNQNEIKV